MAKNNDNIVLLGTTGNLGKQLVIKQYKKGIVVAKFPDMSGITPSKAQENKRSKFAMSVAFAKQINNNPEEHKKWKHDYPEATSVFQAAISWYMKNN